VVPKWSPQEHQKVSLLDVTADVGPAPGDREDQALIAEDFDGTEDSVAAYDMLLL
jgi:hypothetical protein